MNEETERLIGKIQSLVDSGKIDQATLAQKINYSPTVVSLWLKGNYKGNGEKIVHAVKDFLSIQELRTQNKKFKLDFVNTSVASSIHEIARMCQINSEIGVAYGAAGLGKTTALKEYKKNQGGVIVIDPEENVKDSSLIKQLAKELRLSQDFRLETLKVAIENRLKNSGFLIIVDESENLSTSCFKYLRKLHDRCDFTLGILFLGTERLHQNLMRLQGDFKYLTSRVGYCEKLDSLNKEDIFKIVKSASNCSQENLEFFYEYSDSNARVLFNMLKRVKDLKERYKEEVNPEMIEAARQMFM